MVTHIKTKICATESKAILVFCTRNLGLCIVSYNFSREKQLRHIRCMVSHLSLVRIDIIFCGLSSQRETHSGKKKSTSHYRGKNLPNVQSSGKLILAFLKSMFLGNVYKEHFILQCEKMQMAIIGGNVKEWCQRSFFLCVSFTG